MTKAKHKDHPVNTSKLSCIAMIMFFYILLEIILKVLISVWQNENLETFGEVFDFESDGRQYER